MLMQSLLSMDNRLKKDTWNSGNSIEITLILAVKDYIHHSEIM